MYFLHPLSYWKNITILLLRGEFRHFFNIWCNALLQIATIITVTVRVDVGCANHIALLLLACFLFPMDSTTNVDY